MFVSRRIGRLIACFALCPVVTWAAVVLVDFNDHVAGGPGEWNTLVRTFNVNNTQSLLYTDASPSPFTIGPFNTSIPGTTHSMSTASTANLEFSSFTQQASWVAPFAGNDYFFGNTAGQTVGFAISGFETGIVYRVELFSAHGNSATVGSYSFNLWDGLSLSSVGQFNNINVRTNTTMTMSVQFTVNENQNTLYITGTDQVRFNALRMQEFDYVIPEPTTAMLTLLGGYALIFAFRRRLRLA